MNHIVEIWEMTRGGRTICVPACLTCGWTGPDGTHLQAEVEGLAHEDGGAPPRVERRASAAHPRTYPSPPTHERSSAASRPGSTRSAGRDSAP